MNKPVYASSIRESWVSVPTAGGEMGVFLAKPASPARGGIVLLQEIFGVNAAMRDKARAFAAEGYSVLAPDLFWRLAPRIDLGYGEDDRKRGFGFMQKFDQAAGASDIRVAAAWLRGSLAGKPVALVGFCLGGRMAVLAGANNPDVAAVVSFYGVRLDLCPDALRAITAPFQFHVGDQDAHVPASHVAVVQETLADKTNTDLFVYAGAQHGFYNRLRRDVFNAEASEQARIRVLALLQKVTA
jgi:carboxymethylenebutenolidase